MLIKMNVLIQKNYFNIKMKLSSIADKFFTNELHRAHSRLYLATDTNNKNISMITSLHQLVVVSASATCVIVINTIRHVKEYPKVYHFGIPSQTQSSRAYSRFDLTIAGNSGSKLHRWNVVNMPDITNTPKNVISSTYLKHNMLREHVIDTSHHILSLALCQLDRGRRLKHVTELSDLWYS